MTLLQLRALSISKRLYLLTFVVTLLTLIPLFLVMNDFKIGLMEEKRLKTKNLVETAHTLLAHYHSLETSNALSKEEAQLQAKNAIKALRYEGQDYFWINNSKPDMIMHPIKPQLDGTHLGEIKDKAGNFLFSDMAKVVQQQGRGFVNYFWAKPGHEDPVAKISYVIGFQPWDWIVGSGIYVDDVEKIYQQEVKQIAFILSICLIIMLTIAWALGRTIVKPSEEALLAMEDIAQGDGDLTHRLSQKGNDELSKISTAFNTFASKLADMIREMTPVSAHISAAATQLNGVASETAESANQQHHGVDSVAAAMNQLLASNQEVASSAQQAAIAAEEANNKSQQGMIVVKQASNEMASLSSLLEETAKGADALAADSQTIGSVLDVIRGIAEQTNLLALNAAIEAARAGEQGRGFAVVADEVRTLATRTQTSTDEIEQIIRSLQSKAKDVTGAIVQTREQSANTAQHAQQAGVVLDEIGEQVNLITSLNHQIAEACSQQTDATGEINQNLNHLTEHSHNSILQGEQIAAASEQLLTSGQRLQQLISHFKV
ncbi:methyl-accepting chemotaxis protein [Vibrio sp. Of7-15]|uniref:methyl-accepting chemotaxis protein n=1 Tax=Vibrio sp. Of7-15 TaxID=2724879 RepID=UPI001EF3843F|nr:methyl-accepting chemotaxis protein [Vibrio sp. Of7-15]MCG7499482.1 methyl-accepting chemotaxis protein [Vibrio sp. Of7-15]